MLTIAEQRLTESSCPFKPEFEVELKNAKRFLLHSIQDVLALDNSVKNPIRELDVRIPAEPDYGSATETRAHLHFDSGRHANISIAVGSPNTKLATELFAELEEQIDRTVVTSFITRFLKSMRIFWPLALLIVILPLLLIVLGSAPPYNLSAAESADMQRLLSAARTDTEKIDALVQTRLRQLKAAMPSQRLNIDWSWMLSLRGVFIALPVVILIATLSYMIIACYPWAVFAWGDYEQHHNSLVARRKMLGVVVVTALFIGIIGNLFVASVPLR